MVRWVKTCLESYAFNGWYAFMLHLLCCTTMDGGWSGSSASKTGRPLDGLMSDDAKSDDDDEGNK